MTPVVVDLPRARTSRARAMDRASSSSQVHGTDGEVGRGGIDAAKAGGVAGARSVEKATSLGLDSLRIAEALAGVDVTAGADALATQMEEFDVVVVATGFVPGNPFKMNAVAHEVDNDGDDLGG